MKLENLLLLVVTAVVAATVSEVGFRCHKGFFFNLPLFILLRLRWKKLGGNLHKPAKRCSGACEVPNFALGPRGNYGPSPLILREGLYLAVGRM